MLWRADAGSQTGPIGRLAFQRRPEPTRLRLLLDLLIFEAAFFAAYQFSMNVAPRSGAPIWLPDSVLLCALLLSSPRSWWLYIVAPLPLRLLGAGSTVTPTWFLLAAFANDSLKALVAAFMLRWALAGRRIRFDSLHDFWIYLVSTAIVAPALSGVAGAASWMMLGKLFWPTWRNWFLGDALANVVLTPLLLCFATDWRKLINAKPVRYLEGLAVFSGLLFAVNLAYRRGLNNPGFIGFYDYIPVGFLLLAAVRFGPAGASAALALMGMLSVVATSASQFVPSPMDSILSMQLFLLVIGVPILSLAVLLEQQQKTEHSLRESEARFRSMADTVPVMIWISGPDKATTFFNKGWLDFAGSGIEQELRAGWPSRVHADHREECVAGYSSSFDLRSLWQTECQLRRADGQYRWALCSGVPRFDPDGAFAGYIVSCCDISDLKNAQEALLARQKLESLGVLAAGIAHDFNNLLGSIHANAEVAEAVAVGTSFPSEEIQSIKKISMRAAEIVRQLMVYAGNEKSEYEPVDLSRLVREMLALIKVSISKSAILEIDLAHDLPPVLGNAPQIQQVVMNLVLNASDALGGRSGVIGVTLAARPSQGNVICLEVSDTGSGISKDAQSRIFDPFYTTKFAGRGLGLATVQGIVRAHSGAIEVASAPGEGTTFRILLPIAGPASEASRDAVSANATGTRNVKPG
jgi:PAS domain S-box-containing protein